MLNPDCPNCTGRGCMTCPLRYWHGQDCTTDCIYCADTEDDAIALDDEDVHAYTSIFTGALVAGLLIGFITIVGTIAWFVWTVNR